MKLRLRIACLCFVPVLGGLVTAQSLPPPKYQIENTEVVAIRSRALHREYDLYIKLPRSYAEQPWRSYPVLFLHDSPYSFPLVSSLTRQLINAQRIEELVIVGISYSNGDNGDLSRTRDYTPTHSPNESTGHSAAAKLASGQAPAYLRFVVDEVFPFIASHYRVDMSRKTYAGHSFGGLFGAYVITAAPHTFDNYLLSDPSLWYDHKAVFSMIDQAAPRSQAPPNVLIVSARANVTQSPGSHKMVANAQRFAALLKRRFPKGNIEQRTFDGEIHETIFPVAMSHALLRFHRK